MISIDARISDTVLFPKVISFANLNHQNFGSIKNAVYPISTNSTVAHTHEFIENCIIMTSKTYFYLIFVLTWTFLLIIHLLWNCIFQRAQIKYLQKLLIFIPSFYIINCLIDLLFWNSCPWVRSTGENIRYLQIVQIALITVYNTFFIGLCTFLSKGWGLVRNTFTRDELSGLSMTVAVFYLVYSAYFIAQDIESLRTIISISLIIMHGWVIYNCTKNNFKNIAFLNMHIRASANELQIIESLLLKKKMVF